MERFPTLNLVLRFGAPAAFVLAALAAGAVVCAGWPAFGWVSVAAAAVVGGVVFVGVRSYVELVTLITEMLVPR